TCPQHQHCYLSSANRALEVYPLAPLVFVPSPGASVPLLIEPMVPAMCNSPTPKAKPLILFSSQPPPKILRNCRALLTQGKKFCEISNLNAINDSHCQSNVGSKKITRTTD